jgi:hypothetical protein
VSAVTAAELVHRVHARGLRMTDQLARQTLEHWRRAGIAEERLGRWRLTRTGQAMFGGWATAGDLEDDEAA